MMFFILCNTFKSKIFSGNVCKKLETKICVLFCKCRCYGSLRNIGKCGFRTWPLPDLLGLSGSRSDLGSLVQAACSQYGLWRIHLEGYREIFKNQSQKGYFVFATSYCYAFRYVISLGFFPEIHLLFIFIFLGVLGGFFFSWETTKNMKIRPNRMPHLTFILIHWLWPLPYKVIITAVKTRSSHCFSLKYKLFVVFDYFL